MTPSEEPPWDYIVVGSGAGGGTVAARLAESGMRVLVLEAGVDPLAAADPRLPDDYEVPGFHAFASENAAMSRRTRVRHYTDERQQARDRTKYDARAGGVLYPRAAALGGCTAHNAMIFMLPHASDWDHIATLTGDRSWCALQMRRHARQVESCRYRPGWRWLAYLGINPTGHGWYGWLTTERSIPLAALGDPEMARMLALTAWTFVRGLRKPWRGVLEWLAGAGDPNARPWRRARFEGLCYTPLATRGRRRTGTRERLLSVRDRSDGRLRIELGALATRVVLDSNGAAVGVEYLTGAGLPGIPPADRPANAIRHSAVARREVIVAGGAFNTPQLLKLSGIGPAAELAGHSIAVRVDLPAVGRNLQDRYEVAITHRLRAPWQLLDAARFERGDPLWVRWRDAGEGMYASSGAALGLISRSSVADADPDLFCMALPIRFEGYFAGYSALIRQHRDCLTWAILKAHTRNRAGTVTLASADPRDEPRVDFRYFDAGDDPHGKDLTAVVEAIRLVRSLTAPLIADGTIVAELQPGPTLTTDADLSDYVRDTAWGHHAAGSCAISKDAATGVVDGAFRVHGVPRLRIVDASVFPRMPGFFIVSAVYMIAEKAAEVILADAARAPPTP